METFIQNLQQLLQSETSGRSKEEIGILRNLCMTEVNRFFDQLPEEQQTEPVTHLNAHEAVVEFTDEASGLLYRRLLPIDVEENGNGIKLCAEDMNGKPLEMAFYAIESVRRINDLMGNGPDEDSCNTHS